MENFKELIGQAIGEASMCWSETPTGVFDSTRASKIVDSILNIIETAPNVSLRKNDFDSINNKGDIKCLHKI